MKNGSDPAIRPKIGSYQSDLPFAKDLLDFWLTRFPRWYLIVEEHREWQNWDKRVYLSLIRRGDTIIDAGANVGAHTVAFSHIAGAPGHVFSFEAVPANFERLRDTVARRTRHRNTSVFQLALGNPATAEATVLVKVPGDDFTQASLVRHSSGSWERASRVREYPVSLASIDAQAAKLGLDRLDFVKIDVEGGELDVIKGAATTLCRFRPLVYCELYEKWTSSFGYKPADVLALAASLGYTSARVIRDGYVHSMKLGETIPAGLFSGSADVILSAPQHSARIARFDSRYCNQHDEPSPGT